MPFAKRLMSPVIAALRPFGRFFLLFLWLAALTFPATASAQSVALPPPPLAAARPEGARGVPPRPAVDGGRGFTPE